MKLIKINSHSIVFLIVLSIIFTLSPPYFIPSVLAKALNYLSVGLVILYILLQNGKLRTGRTLNLIFIFSILNLILSESITQISFYLPFFIMVGIVAHDYVIKNDVSSVNLLVNIFIFMGIWSMLIIYLKMGNIPGFGSYYGGWLYEGGFSLGITKGGLGFFGTLSLIWFLVKEKYLCIILFFILFHSVFLSSRLIGFVTLLVIFLHFFLNHIKIDKSSIKGAVAFFGAWSVIFSGIFYSIFIKDNFDRLPSYAVGFDVIDQTGNIFGLGFRNYQYYIKDNFERLNVDYFHLMPKTVNMIEFYTSAESTYADSFASYGVLGILMLIMYNVVLLTNFKNYFQFTSIEKWFVLVWAVFVFGGIAQDFTAANGFFYLIFGVNVALLKKSSSAFSKTNLNTINV